MKKLMLITLILFVTIATAQETITDLFQNDGYELNYTEKSNENLQVYVGYIRDKKEWRIVKNLLAINN